MKLFTNWLESRISVVSLLISAVVAWLVVPPRMGFPMIAFFIFFIIVGSLVYIVRKNKTWFDLVVYCGILALSVFTIYRANGFLQFFDFIFIMFFGSLLIRSLNTEHGVFTLLVSPILVIIKTLIAKNIFPYTLKVPVKYAKTTHFLHVLPTIALTILIIVITLPLLASANPFFNALLQNLEKFFDLGWFFRYIFAESFMVYVIRAVAFVFLAFFIPRMLSISVEGVTGNTIKPFFSINYLVPKIVMAGLLVIFFITQIQLYFATPQTLQSMGYTNSRLTNEVFAQVTVVAFIVFLLAYFDKSRKVWHARLTYFLLIEAFFLICIAFKSVYDYSFLYGLTQKRLWGYTSMAWLTGALVAFVYHFRAQTSNLSFIKQILTYTVGVVILVNVLNFDYLIYHYSKPTVAGGVDYVYLSGLSPDAHDYKDVLSKLMTQIESSNQSDYKVINSAYQILGTLDYLRIKYGKEKNINSFNSSEYQEYLSTKDMNLEGYRESILQKLNANPQPALKQ